MTGALTSKNIPSVSLIIPVRNEEQHLARLLRFLREVRDPFWEVIVVDGGSRDATRSLACKFKVRLLTSPLPSRALQMNIGAKIAKGDILYFLHADTLPPTGFLEAIRKAYIKGKMMGCFRLKLEPARPGTAINSYFSRFPSLFSGGGD